MSGIESFSHSLLIYLPLSIILVIVLGYMGFKLAAIARSGDGISGYFNNFIAKFFGIKQSLNKVQNFFWPNNDEIRDGRTGASIKADSVLIGLGALYILLMIILYNDELYKTIKIKVKNGLFSIFNPILNFMAPSTWNKVRRNIRLKNETIYEESLKDKYPLLLGGIGLLLGFTVFISLLVNTYNINVKKSNAQEHNEKLMKKTQKWLYRTIFTGVALAIFSVLLYYAATTSSAPKFLMPLLIFASIVIILAAVLVLFRERIFKYLDNPFIRIIYNVIFVIPCLFIDLVNFIYYELKNSPKFVYLLFILELVIIASIFIIPIVTKWMYLNMSKDKNFKEKVDNEISLVNSRKRKIKHAINIIKSFDPNKNEFKKITANGNTVKTEKIDPKNVKVKYNVVLYKKPTNVGFFKKYCMDYNRDGNKGELEYEGLMNVITGKIKWMKIKTVDGFGQEFYNDSLRSKCKWDKSKESNEDKVKYFGVNGNPPTEYTSMPMNLDKLIKKYTSYQRKELEETLKERKEMLILKNSNNAKDLGSMITKKIIYIKDKAKDILNSSDITSSINIQSSVLNEGAWEKIIKNNLDNEQNLSELNKMLRGYGFSDLDQCVEIGDRYKKRKCIENYKKIVKHVQVNTKQLLLFNNTLEELDNRIKDLETMKVENTGIFDKGIECLKEPVYFRQKLYLMNHNKFLKLRPEQHSYNYSISCWFFIHSHPPNYKKSYTKYTNILNFNYEPIIAYNTKKNTLLIKSFKAKGEYDKGKGKNKLVDLYVGKKFKLQKWHNIVVNYIGGTVDVFLNGELVATNERITPFKTFNNMIVGQNNGISGSICNVIYYPNHISKSKISMNYNYLKKKSPPVI